MTKEEAKQEALDLIKVQVSENCTPVDREALFDAMLDECYSFKDVGGPFAYMIPSRVLKEMDPTAYRCGVNDYIDGLDVTEFDGEDYNDKDLDDAKECVSDGLRERLESLDEEHEKVESEDLDAVIKAVEDFSF